MRRVMGRIGRAGAIAMAVIACLAAIGALVVRLGAVPYFESRLLITQDPTTTTITPESYGVAYRARTIDSHGRSLQAWIVNAGAKTPAILFFHGNGQTIHDLACVQAYLYRHGISSMVFDYSGFGQSTGKATVRNLDQDALAAWRAFVAWAGPARAKFAVGYSLGTGILLHAAARFKQRPDGIAVYGAFSSIKHAIVHLRDAPAWLAPLGPDIWNNVAAASHLDAPLLVVAGADDTIVPPAMGRPIAREASSARGGRYVLIPGVGHDGIVAHMPAVWSPILKFIQARVAPRAMATRGNVAGPASSTAPGMTAQPL
ncbi:MAG: alpha/beta fold hydrolase [Rhodanobacteraceae bacterium]|nr:MAG: alpha/beta fold hydrolase [Rhodanobacteraceae bacterium]